MAKSVFSSGGAVAKKTAIGQGMSQRHTCYAPFVKTNEGAEGFAQASGNGVQLNETGLYAISCFANAWYGFGDNTSKLSITQPEEEKVDIDLPKVPSDTQFIYFWRGNLKAGSVVTLSMTNVYSGSSEAMLRCILEIVKLR